MPLFEFQCKKCQKEYDEFARHDTTGEYPGVKCPFCASEEKLKLISNFSFSFKNPQESSKWYSESQGHDYRYKSKLPEVLKQREQTEKQENPYKELNNDLNNNEAWDFNKA